MIPKSRKNVGVQLKLKYFTFIHDCRLRFYTFTIFNFRLLRCRFTCLSYHSSFSDLLGKHHLTLWTSSAAHSQFNVLKTNKKIRHFFKASWDMYLKNVHTYYFFVLPGPFSYSGTFRKSTLFTTI